MSDLEKWMSILQEEKAVMAQEHRMPNNMYFRMGAAVAVGELFDSGVLGYGADAARETRAYLGSFGLRTLTDIQDLGIRGPYMDSLQNLYAMA